MTRKLDARRDGAVASTATYSNLQNRPGTFLTIPIDSLRVDTEYQRPVLGSRVDKMSRDWSWIACGVITVALRGPGSGDYVVIDGQHRMEAALRAGVTELPCIVFESLAHTDEAQGFLDVNTARKGMSVIDRYRALLVVEDPIALEVKRLLELANRTPEIGGARSSVHTSGVNAIACLEFLMRAIEHDPVTLETIWPLTNDICEGRLLTKKLLAGLFYLERFLTNTSITERHWSRRLLQIGYDSLHRSIDETIVYEGKAGSAVCARGILRAVNKGLRRKLQLETETTTTTTADDDVP